MEDKLYWLWFTLKNITPKRQIDIYRIFGSVKAIYDTDDYDSVLNLPEPIKKELEDKSLDRAEQVIKRIEELDGYIMTIEDNDYPDTLSEIPVPPLVLYCRGQRINWQEAFRITVVGTRSYSSYGRRATEKIVRELTDYNTIIVTGMARGIDAIANCAALHEGCPTAAVLGCGVDVIYPPEYKSLYNAIIKNGVVISEFPPGTKPLGKNFPRRNRILAAMGNGVLVGQAPMRSGALITAAYAIDNGEPTYVIPADIFDKNFAGSNALITQGAKLVTCAEDITEDFAYIAVKTKPEKKREKRKEEKKEVSLEGLSETEIKLVSLLSKKNSHIDELIRETGLASAEVNATLVMLEISGTVKKLSGNIYCIA
ncbi:MAG: DNA-processing protein DprA [Oscillospiraceae bacterium]|nr:DNA-processing protein DprA [Oscillospiraceae bacterium]